MREISLKARAKINLTLDVVGKREDGYHLIETIMQNVHLYDYIYMKPIHKNDIIIKSNLHWLPTDQRNLAYKAVQSIKEKYGLNRGVFIEMNKRIPVSAGLGGGSADCAAVLVGMNQLFQMGISRMEMEKIGEELGSDIPYCLRRGTVLGTGVGADLYNLKPCPKFYIVLGKLPISVSTAIVYKNIELDKIVTKPDTKGMISAIEKGDVEKIGRCLGNSLEDVTIKIVPEIARLKETLMNNGAIGSMMSGSGPTVFGIFDSFEKARIGANAIRREHKLRDIFITEIFHSGQIPKGAKRYGRSKV